MPERIQRKRTKGWRMPEGTVYVGRPTKWGNPFSVNVFDGRTGGFIKRPRHEVVTIFRNLIIARDGCDYSSDVLPKGIRTEDIRRELRGKDLACWCPLDQPCHADVLLEIANAPGVHP